MSNSLCRPPDSLGDALGPAWPEKHCVYTPQTSDLGISGSFWMGRDTVWRLLQRAQVAKTTWLPSCPTQTLLGY